jgi:hypothetical protein
LKSDLKVNYSIIGNIRDKIATYKSAIEVMEESLNNIKSRLETENSGEAVAALISKHEDLQGDIDSCKGELEDLFNLFSGYHDEMTGIISPKNYSSIMQVDRDDIYWNMESIFGACDAVGMIRYKVSTYRSFPSFSDTDEEKENQERNYSKMEEIWSIINSYKSRFDEDKDDMANLFNNKIVPYEDKDDEYASRAGNVYDKYASSWERMGKFCLDVYEAKENLKKALGKCIEGSFLGIFKLQNQVYDYAIGGIAVLVSKVTGDTPDWLEESEETFYKDNETIRAVIDDPTVIVEGMAQQASDAKDEKGIVYCVGYTGGLIAQAILLKKWNAGEGVTQTEIRERVLKNIEESKIAREASNYQEFAKIDIRIYAENNNWVDKAGNSIWPPNRGLDGEAVIKILKPGTRIDRYGFEGGTFVSPEGIPYPNRSLAPGTEKKPYNVYEVIKPIEVQAGKIAPWFGEPGGGIQYELSESIKKLREDEFIRRVEIK